MSFRVPRPSIKREHSSFKHNFPLTTRRSSNASSCNHDELRFSLVGLHGRDFEMKQQRDALARIRSSECGRELILLSGNSGTGKTKLACSLEAPTKRCGGFFASGKFDIQRSSEPYTAFLMAFDHLFDEIFFLRKYNEKKFEEIKCAITKAVGSDVDFLTSVIPNLGGLISDAGNHSNNSSSVLEPLGPNLKNKFNYLIRQFVRAVCVGCSSLLVILVDDLQWADTSSLDLINNLLTDNLNSGLLIIGCYRDNEIETKERHQLAMWLQALWQYGCIQNGKPQCDDSKECNESQGQAVEPTFSGDDEIIFNVTTIPVSNLSKESLNGYLEDLLSSNKSATSEFAAIVHKRTGGNMFFVRQFLESLKGKGLLTYNVGLASWMWDVQSIRSNTSATNNVVVLVQKKMEAILNQESKEILQIAACLGFNFDVSMLLLVVLEMSKETGTDFHTVASTFHQCLGLCMDEGILEVGLDSGANDRSGRNISWKYRFVHDQIHHAAISLQSDKDLNHFQLRIGEILVRKMSEESLEKNIFVAVNLLNKGTEGQDKDIAKMTVNQNDIARFNLQAGKKAMRSSAFTLCSDYLKTAIQFIDQDSCWQSYSNDMTSTSLAVDIYSTAAQAEYCNGNFDLMEKYLNIVLKCEGLPMENKFNAYSTLLDGLQAQGRYLEAVNHALCLLSELGVNLPRKCGRVSVSAVKISFQKTKLLLRGKSMEELLDLPMMQDKMKIMAMSTLSKLLGTSSFVNPNLTSLVAFKMLRYSVRYGMNVHAPTAFNFYGVALCVHTCDLKGGSAFGELAMSLVDKLNAREIKSRVTLYNVAFISHWLNPLPSSSGPHLDGYQIGMETGDMNAAMWNIYFYLCVQSNSGCSLALVEQDMKQYAEEMKQYNQFSIFSTLSPLWQFTLCLMGRADDPTVLSGEAMTYDKHLLEHLKENNNVALLDFITVLRFFLAFYFNKFEAAWELVEEAAGFEKSNNSSIFLWRKLMLQGLTAFSLASETKKNCRKWKSRALAIKKRLKKWVSLGNVNCVHAVFLLQAEEAALDGKNDEAYERYSAAITASGRAGFLHDKALAHERAGEFCLGIGDSSQTKFHLQTACQLYSEWGAIAKADDVRRKLQCVVTKDTAK